jgi:archaellum component FlaF (FlaF/FlaG flagellin family)
MRKLYLIVFLLITINCFSQTKKYEFDSMYVGNQNGWVNFTKKGEFHFEDDKVILVTNDSIFQFNITSKSYWVSDSSIMLGCLNWESKTVTMRVVTDSVQRMNSNWIDLYVNYDDKCFKFCLNKRNN